MQDIFIEYIAKQLSIPLWQVKNTIELIESGATVPFIARYRKEKTGNLDEVQIADISQKYTQLNELQKRKVFILKSIEEQGKLTSELQNQIQNSWDETLIEDLYLPYKSRKKTKADIAIERGLKPLAKILMAQKGHDFEVIAEKYVKGEVESVEDAIQGAKEIVSQWISEYINIRNGLRKLFWQKGQVYSKIVKGKETEAEKFQDYFDFSEPVKSIKSHRLLAIVRGSNEGFLKIKVEPSKEDALALMERFIVKSDCDFKEEITEAIEHAYAKILKPSLKNETLQELKQKADVEAIKVFAENLRQLLLQPPLGSYRTLAIDPGFRTGCKVVCLDANGDLLHNETIYPHPPQKEIGPAKKKIATLVAQFKIEAIAIGNGTAGRETEFFIKGIQFDRAVKVFVVNEAGASIYSASKVARDEFPQYDITVRGSVSIGRRLMDPMAELVKIDPKSIGVGQYQHDVNQKLLQTELDNVVVSSVNKVGVELNTASKYLLQYVSGIGPALAQKYCRL
jgi:protein Tex